MIKRVASPAFERQRRSAGSEIVDAQRFLELAVSRRALRRIDEPSGDYCVLLDCQSDRRYLVSRRSLSEYLAKRATYSS